MKQEEINDIYWELNNVLNTIPEDTDISKFREMANERLGVRLKYVDDWIDDGISDENNPDEYVMGRSFDFSYKGVNWYLRVFFGNNTRKVGCFDVRED